MNRRKLKETVLSLLEKEQWPAIATVLLQYEETAVVNHLFTALCNNSERCKWHAVSSFGVVVPRLAAKHLESARIVMRRFLWSLNDESGGIGWGIPEAMAEVMAQDDTLFEEYSHMLISYMQEDGPEPFQDGNFLELPALQQGLIWGVGRLLSERRKAMIDKKVAVEILKYLDSPDKTVRGLAAWCLGMCGDARAAGHLQRLTDDEAVLSFYHGHVLREAKVCELAQQAIRQLHDC